jgi:hypothetical protein
MTYLQGDCSYRRAEEEERFKICRVHVLNTTSLIYRHTEEEEEEEEQEEEEEEI